MPDKRPLAAGPKGRLAAPLLSVTLIVGGLGFLEAGHALVVSAPLANPDAIVTLASHEWERLPVAARLAHANPLATVLLSTPARVSVHNCHGCSQRIAWLVGAGVPPARVILLPQRVRNTRDEAAATFAYVREHHLRSLVIVTSPYHGRRALATFRKVFRGLPVRIGLSTALKESGATPQRWWTRPYDRSYVAYEWAALSLYIVRYGVVPFGFD